MKLILRIEHHYGRDRFHPANELARKFCKLTGQKTLVVREISIIKEIGYTIEFTHRKPNLEISEPRKGNVCYPKTKS